MTVQELLEKAINDTYNKVHYGHMHPDICPPIEHSKWLEMWMKKHSEFIAEWQRQQPAMKQEDLKLPCPQCGGSGIVSGIDYVAGCCRHFNEDGSCCSVPIPEPVEVAEQCEYCQSTGIVQLQYENFNVDLALKLSRVVHDECKDVPHDIGIKLAVLVEEHQLLNTLPATDVHALGEAILKKQFEIYNPLRKAVVEVPEIIFQFDKAGIDLVKVEF